MIKDLEDKIKSQEKGTRERDKRKRHWTERKTNIQDKYYRLKK